MPAGLLFVAHLRQFRFCESAVNCIYMRMDLKGTFHFGSIERGGVA